MKNISFTAREDWLNLEGRVERGKKKSSFLKLVKKIANLEENEWRKLKVLLG